MRNLLLLRGPRLHLPHPVGREGPLPHHLLHFVLHVCGHRTHKKSGSIYVCLSKLIREPGHPEVSTNGQQSAEDPEFARLAIRQRSAKGTMARVWNEGQCR